MKLNKKCLVALTITCLSLGNISKADTVDNFINHRLVCKVVGGLNFGSADKAFEAITNIKNKKSENTKWNFGGALEYDYFFNSYLGIGFNLDVAYQQLWKYDLSDMVFETTNIKKEVNFCGFYATPTIRILCNFLKDGFIFDEEEKKVKGSKFGVAVDFGCNANFSNIEIGKIFYENVTPFKDSDAHRAVLSFLNSVIKIGAFFELPMGIGGEINWKELSSRGGILEQFKHVENNPDYDKAHNDGTLEKFRQGIDFSIFYDLGRFL